MTSGRSNAASGTKYHMNYLERIKMMYEFGIMEELPLDHDPSLIHWAKCIADDDIATGYETNWDYAYEQALHYLDAEYNYNYEYQEG